VGVRVRSRTPASFRVLDSLGVHPQLVVGTSMGAVVGALYASGMSGRAIDSVVRTLPVNRLFSAAPDRLPQAVGDLRPLLAWEGGRQGFTSGVRSGVTPRSTCSRLGCSSGAISSRAARSTRSRSHFARSRRTCSTRETVVLDRGDLAEAVRASFAIPVVLPPEYIDGRALVDGGLSANVPIRIRARGGLPHG